ncbi:MAG: hypothetical protein WKF58_18370 [Ilumatobacteraceae bacterium]
MRGHLEVDLRTQADREQLRATHERALHDIDHLQHLVADLLELARHDEHRIPARQEPVDLDDLVLDQTRHLRDHERITVDLSGVSRSGSPVIRANSPGPCATSSTTPNDTPTTPSPSTCTRPTDGHRSVSPTTAPASRHRTETTSSNASSAPTKPEPATARAPAPGSGSPSLKPSSNATTGTIELDTDYTGGAQFVITVPAPDTRRNPYSIGPASAATVSRRTSAVRCRNTSPGKVSFFG